MILPILAALALSQTAPAAHHRPPPDTANKAFAAVKAAKAKRAKAHHQPKPLPKK